MITPSSKPGEIHAIRFKLYCIDCKHHDEFEACVFEGGESVKCGMYVPRGVVCK
jgi:hypothetical protein